MAPTISDIEIILDRNNFFAWRKHLLVKLLRDGVSNWVLGPDGSNPRPNQAALGAAWDKLERTARRIILNSISDNVLEEYEDIAKNGSSRDIFRTIDEREAAMAKDPSERSALDVEAMNRLRPANTSNSFALPEERRCRKPKQGAQISRQNY